VCVARKGLLSGGAASLRASLHPLPALSPFLRKGEEAIPPVPFGEGAASSSVPRRGKKGCFSLTPDSGEA